ncbi:hypothetical protein [Butyrivibrio sp. AD3002]|nr:hypothetical protein [Butyrivibrio sp. AD3002]
MPLCGITETSSDAESVVVVHSKLFRKKVYSWMIMMADVFSMRRDMK